MINLINTYVEMQKKLYEEYGVINVSTYLDMPEVQIYELDKFLNIYDGQEITIISRSDSDYNHEAYFIIQNIRFLIVLDDEKYNEIIKIEGVTHE